MSADSDLTKSARKRRFFRSLEQIDQVEEDESEDEAAVNAESFFKEIKDEPDPQCSHSFTSQSNVRKSDSKATQKTTLKYEIIPDSGSDTQSDHEDGNRQIDPRGALKPQPKAQVVLDSSSETQSEPGTPPGLRRVQSLTTKARRSAKTVTTKPPLLKSAVSAPPRLRNEGMERQQTKRRKVESQAVQCPQIFAGKKFFFVPNDDVNRARKLRMSKVEQHGGLRVQSWSDDIDFLAIEDSISYESLLAWLQNEYKIIAIPVSMRLVNTKFIGDCFIFRSVMDFTQPCYGVKPTANTVTQGSGQPTKSVVETPSSLKMVKQASNLRSKNRMASPPPLTRNLSAKESEMNTMTGEEELMEAFKEAKELQFLSFNDSDDGFGNDELASLSSLPYEDTREWQKNFACMHAGGDALMAQNPNARTISILDQMSHYYDNMGDEYRSMSYRKAVTALKKEHRRIVTKKDALAIRSIGDSIAEKIEEIALTERLKKLDNLMNDSRGQVLQLFTRIYGVGMNQASRWVGMGHRTLDDLLTKAKLSDVQKIGVEHYDDFMLRIPRDEVKQHGDRVRDALRKIDLAFEITVGGSYRRGKPDSGDIDLIITKPGANIEEIRAVALGRLIPELVDAGFLTVRLAGSRGTDGNKWHGCSVLPGSTTWRRIDFLFVPWDEMGAALIYFTGNDIFNRSIRLLASKKKMCLNQTGLYGSVLRKRNREKINDGELLESKSERRIFEILGVPWRAPHERNL